MRKSSPSALARLPRIRRALSAVAVVLGIGTAAQAMEFQVRDLEGRRIVIALHDVTTGDAARLAQVLDRAGRVDEVWFHSPGGVTLEGYRIGRLIRERGLATRVPARARCASACTDAFLGGAARRVDAGGALGVHMPTVSRAAEARDWVTAQIQQHGAEAAGSVIRTFEQLSARETATWIRYVVEMGVSTRLIERAVQTPADSMHWLSPEEMQAYGIVTEQAGARTAAGPRPSPSGPTAATTGQTAGPGPLAARRPASDDGLPRIN